MSINYRHAIGSFILITGIQSMISEQTKYWKWHNKINSVSNTTNKNIGSKTSIKNTRSDTTNILEEEIV